MDTKPKTGAQGALPFRGDNPPVGAQVYPGDNREKASMPNPADSLRKDMRRSSNNGVLDIPQRIG